MSEIVPITGAYEWSISRFAEALGMSRNTVSKRIREKQIKPARKVAGNFVYAIKDVMPALFSNESAVSSGQVNPDVMLPGDRKAWFQSENERIKFLKDINVLCDASDVAREFSLLAKAVVQVLDTLPDVLERDCGLTPKQVAKVQGVVDDLRDQMALQAGEMNDEADLC